MSRRNLPDVIGQTFYRLTVIKEVEQIRSHRMVECKCSCGNFLTARLSSLLSGNTKSCGCLRKEAATDSASKRIKHGHTLGRMTKEYSAWSMMLQRCYNPKDEKYKSYNKRGIIVCDRWKTSFVNFLKDMGKKPSPFHRLYRRNINGNYEPDNCRWATFNQISNVCYIVDGKKICHAEFARRMGVSPASISFLKKRGYTTKQIINHYKNKQNHATPIGTDSIQ